MKSHISGAGRTARRGDRRSRRLRFERLEHRWLLAADPAIQFLQESVDYGSVLETQPSEQAEVYSFSLEPASFSPSEQLFVYLLNRARHDPLAYQIERGLDVDLSSVDPRPPLAINGGLHGSARFHAEEMAEFNYFAHQSQVTGRWPNKNARDHGYPLPAWWSDDANNIESIAAGNSTTEATLEQLIRSPGHRDHLLGINAFFAANREAGVGYGHSPTSTYRHYWAVHLARTEPSQTFLTGVVFEDANGNGRYDLNEGLGGVTVTVGNTTAMTNAAGGWTVAVPPNDAYQVTVAGAGFAGTATAGVMVGSDNRQIDFISGQTSGIVDFNALPAVSALTANPDPVIRPGEITLTAEGVFDPDGQVVLVEFYRGDVLLGTDDDGNDGWSWSGSTADWELGEYTFFARAQDDDEAWSEMVSTTATVIAAPTPMADLAGRAGGDGMWWVAESTGSQFVNASWGRWSTAVDWSHVLVGDFTGDGYDDLAGQTPGGDWWIARSTGSGFVNEHWGRWNPGAGWTDVQVGDFNGDGRADILGRTASGDWWVARSTGSGFVNEHWGRWSTAIEWTDIHVGDFTGDGLADVAGRTAASGDWWIARSTGDGFVNEHWGRWSTATEWTDIRVADFTGDGSADLVGRTAINGDWWIARSTGDGFVNERWGRWSTATEWTDIQVGDFTGDGLADLAGRTANSGDWWIARSTGDGFVNERWGRWSTATDWTDIRTGDFTGDGLADLAGRTANNGDWWVARSTGDGFVNERWGRWSTAVQWEPVLVGNFAPAPAVMQAASAPPAEQPMPESLTLAESEPIVEAAVFPLTAVLQNVSFQIQITDLPGVMHEPGHLPGYDHRDLGLMGDSLSPGGRHRRDDEQLWDGLLNDPLAESQVDDFFASVG